MKNTRTALARWRRILVDVVELTLCVSRSNRTGRTLRGCAVDDDLADGPKNGLKVKLHSISRRDLKSSLRRSSAFFSYSVYTCIDKYGAL